MTAALTLASTDRLLVFAPHPDDETLATGELIQCAVAVGASVRVVFATDGDNNPWPQRWLERRWRIDAAARARWGRRRRGEALAALAVLGVDGRASARFLGWADQGLTDALMADDRAVAVIADEIARYAPTQVAVPLLADRHPDHSALRVMVDLALLANRTPCVRLGYVVHGAAAPAVVHALPRVVARQALKQRAMLAHASQIALSRRRLLALAARTEHFERAEAGAAVAPWLPRRLRIPLAANGAWRRRHTLLLIIATRTGDLRFRLPVQADGASATSEALGHAVQVEWTREAAIVSLPAIAAAAVAVYAKLDRARPRLVVFDREAWHVAADLAESGAEEPLGGAATPSP